MTRSSVRLAVVATVLGALAVAACGPGATSPPPSIATPTSSPSATPSSPAASVAASPSTPALPPDASLTVEGGDPVVGQLGSFTWGDGGSDSPWLPGTPTAAAAGEPLSVTLAGGTAIASWTAVRAPAESATGAGATGAGAGSGTIGFAIAEPGRWTVAVTIGFGGGGSATYYWQLDVT